MARAAARFGVSTLALLALVGCAAAPPAATPPAIATAVPPLSQDEDFLNRAATGTGNEVELGRLAQAKALALPVRAFGAHIAAEHSQVHARLMTLAQRLKRVPNTTTPDLSSLAALSGSDFDRQFIADQIKDQREALSLFADEAQAGEDPQLRRFARERMPLLRRDLERAQTIIAGLGE